MLDIGKLRYRLILLDENGVQYDLKDVVQDLGYEENENELASRITFRLADVDGALELCRNGQMVFLLAGFDGKDEEICRGTLKTWRHTYGLTARTADCTVYDTLYQLDKSQDNRYISSGRTTAQVFAEIAADWGIEMVYHGPDVSHGAMPMKNKTPAKMFLELLDDARKKGPESTYCGLFREKSWYPQFFLTKPFTCSEETIPSGLLIRKTFLIW